MEELNEHVAVVTGGASGIGEGLAKRCAREGMRVVVADLEAAPAEKVAETIRKDGGAAIAVATDVSNPDAVNALADATWNEFGACHLLCNNAGVLNHRDLADSSVQDWQWILGVNLMGVVHGVQAFAQRMIAQGEGGHIVNTGSIAGLYPLAGMGIYSTTKFAVVGLSETLRQELEPHGIGVSVLCPGGVDTQINAAERNRPADLGGGEVTVPDPTVGGASNLPEGMSRVLTADQVAQLVLAGVRANDLHIATHPAWGDAIGQRMDGVRAAFDVAEQRLADIS